LNKQKSISSIFLSIKNWSKFHDTSDQYNKRFER
jgi:hypothetical protein